MSYVPSPRGTLLVLSGPQGNHLYVIMNQACSDGLHLMLGISSIKPGKSHDTACEFSGGEHEFITKPSFVYYRDPLQRQSAFIARCVENGAYGVKANMDDANFQRICEGIGKSDFIRPWAVKYAKDNGII